MTCALCSAPARERFCCNGCRVVYEVLDARKELANFNDHPLYRQAKASGLISGEEEPTQVSGETKRLHLEIGGMWCPACAEVIALFLLRLRGVAQATIDWATDIAIIDYHPTQIAPEAISERISSLSYEAAPLNEGRGVERAHYLRLGVATFCAANLMMFAYPLYFAKPVLLLAQLSFFLSLPLIAVGWPIWKRAFQAARVRRIGMEALVTLGVGAAFALSTLHVFQGSTAIYYDSMGVIIALVLLGRVLEQRAKFSAKETLLQLARSLPRKCKRLSDDKVEQVLAKEVARGEQLLIVHGERIALDGIIVEGSGSADESLVTGESIPVSKEIGDRVIGGSVLQCGRLVIAVTATAEESLLQRLVHTIRGDLQNRRPSARLIDHVARWFAPAVLLLAPFAGSLEGFASVLLIACPCAIGIAAPLAESLLMSRLARLGIIVRNREALARLGKENYVVFDKTGTLTEGKFQLHTDLSTLTAEDKQILKGLAQQSSHPISRAIAAALPDAPAHPAEELPGLGLRSSRALLGSRHLLEQEGIAVTESATCYFVLDGRPTPLHLFDATRPDAPDLLASIPANKRVLLSGDQPDPVADLATSLHIDHHLAECTPDSKRQWILDHNPVVMVGDGINDAPALAAASIGIAVASASDLAIQVSDLMLTRSRLSSLRHLWPLARRGRRIIRQNIFWAFSYNTVGVALALFGFCPPLLAASAMAFSSLAIILNTSRLLKSCACGVRHNN